MAASGVTHEFQYATARTSRRWRSPGMWLFLATEVLLFGGLILAWIYSRHFNPVGFDAGCRETALTIGTVNTALLITSSFAYALGAAFCAPAVRADSISCLALALALAARSWC